MSARADPAAVSAGVATASLDPCPTCGHDGMGHFCVQCGERRLGPEDLTLRHFAAGALAQFTSVDAALPRTLRALVRAPGSLTEHYLLGRRRPFLRPLQLFLLVNVAFFLLSAMLGADTLSSRLVTHLELLSHGEAVRPLVEQEVERRGITLEAYARTFDARVATQGRALVIVMAPAFALLVALLRWRDRRPAVAHLVFAVHYLTFFLLLLICFGLLVGGLTLVVQLTGRPLDWRVVDEWSVAYLLAGTGVYLHFALRRVYAARPLAAAAGAAVVALATLQILQLYRMLLFFTTFYSL